MSETPHPPMVAKLHRYHARFEPRPGDVGAIDVSVVDEVWKANDYRIPTGGLRGTVLDVGANIGAFSVLAAKAGANVVVSVEPHPENRARLEHHAALNGVTLNIDPRAVSGYDCDHPMILTGNGGGAHQLSHAEDADGRYEADVVGLGTLLACYGPIEFLKMDIEGGEYDAFDGIEAHDLDEHVAQIALEFHGPHMPHLGHLDDDGGHTARWGALVALLADCGHLEIMGHPAVGGLIHWRRY